MITYFDECCFSYLFLRLQQETVLMVRSRGRQVVFKCSYYYARLMVLPPSSFLDSLIILIFIIKNFACHITQILTFGMQETRGIVKFTNEVLTGNQCLLKRFGEYVDLIWNKVSGEMQICPSKHTKFSFQVKENQEIIHHVLVKHGSKCQHMFQHFTTTTRPMRPCSCVYIQHQQNNSFLGTLRPQKLSFGGQWVLPGGHLQKGESIIDGGIRQCQQQVNLDTNKITKIDYQSAMIWQSVSFGNEVIKATALVIFFKILTKGFDVVVQKQQVEESRWIESGVNSLQMVQWAEGHLNYLRFIQQSGK